MELAFGKMGGLIPTVIQDERSGEVLMLGFMNEEALRATRESDCSCGRVVSRRSARSAD